MDKFNERVQALERALADDRQARQSELASITQSLERIISEDRKQRQTEQASLLQALTQHRENASTQIQEVQQALLSEIRRLQLPANFAQMLRDEFATRMGALESSMQTLLQSFITTQQEVRQLNTLLAQLPTELETIHTQFRGALSRDREVFKNELVNTLPTQVPYSDDLIEQLNREFAQLRTELLTALSARAPVTEPMPTLALTPFDGQRPADEQVSERLVPVFHALVALETDMVAWVAQQKADVHTSADFLIEHLQVLKTRVYPSQPPALPPSNGEVTEQVEQPERTVVVEEQEL